MISLTPAQVRFLKAQAHNLNPVVMIGDAGLSEAVLKEAEATLAKHELIKIKVHSDDRDSREALLSELCDKLGATPVQHIGKILVIYRAAKEPKIKLP